MSTEAAKAMEPIAVNPDRGNDLLAMTILVIDSVLLAMLELMFVTLSLGTVPLPVSAAVALVTTPLLVVAAGKLAKGTLGTCGPLIAWLVTICLLGFFGPGGDVLLLGTWPSLLLIVAGLVPAAFVLGRVLRGKLRRAA